MSRIDCFGRAIRARSMRTDIRGLYAVTPDEIDTARLARLVQEAVEGGAKLVQYRNKIASHALRIEQARALLAICQSATVPLIVNDHLDIARAIGADSLHLGEDDGDIARVREALPGAILGVSCYNEDRSRRARRALGRGLRRVRAVLRIDDETRRHSCIT